jgi:hypothetical protein
MKNNWYIQAKTSTNEDIIKLLKVYDGLDKDNPQKNSLKEEIKGYLELKDNPFNKIIEEQAKTKDNAIDDNLKTSNDFYSEKELVDKTDAELNKIIDECIIRKKELEKGRLKHETFKEKLAMTKRMWKFTRIANISRKIINERRHKIKVKESSTKLSKSALKKAKFCQLIRAGYSFSNICRHPEGVKIEEIEEIVDNDVIEICKKNNPDFLRKWNSWKNKFLKK